MSLLDPIFINFTDEVVKKAGTIAADSISDHRMVYCELQLKDYKPPPKFVKFRDFKHFHRDMFLETLELCNWHEFLRTQDINMKISLFNKYLIESFDQHAPYKTVRISKKPAPWLTDEIRRLMKSRDRQLCEFKRSDSSDDWSKYKVLRNKSLAVIRQRKKGFLYVSVRSFSPNEIWKTIGYLTGLKKRKLNYLKIEVILVQLMITLLP